MNRLVNEQHLRLFRRFLEILGEEGILADFGEEWEVLRSPTRTDPDGQAETLLKKYPDHNVELTLTMGCGAQLAALLRGEADPLQILFPGGDLEFTSRIYKASPLARTLNTVAKDAINRKSGARGLRAILECVMLDIMYDIPSTPGVRECIVGEEVISKSECPLLLYENQVGYA